MDDLKSLVLAQKEKFEYLSSGKVSFNEEALFAVQAMTNNSYLADTARKNPEMTKMAILNIAAIGLTLNPLKRQAYLIPRDGKIIVDVSYIGMIQIATEAGNIKWCEAQVVYENDYFEVRQSGERPIHQYKPFESRGKKIGCYCVAKVESDYLVSIMSIEEIYKIRNKSMSYTKGRTSPWTTDEDEMIKKSVIKRAFKTWPTNDRTKLAIEQSIDADPVDNSKQETISAKQSDEIRALLAESDRKEEDLIKYINLAHNSNIETLSDFDLEMYKTAKTMMLNIINNKGAKK